jgi:hypothetical protein
MADKNILEQMLEHLVNDDQAKAEELFHEYVVGKSREIYEELIESEIEDDEDEEVDEAAEKDEDSDDEEVEEGFEDLAVEGDDEDDMMDIDPMGGDPTDDLEAELDDGDVDSEEEGSPEDLFQDLESIVDELQAKFDELQGGMGDEEGEMDDEEGEMDDEGGNPFAKEEDFELETVREYVEKVTDGHGAEKKGRAETADSKKSVVDNMKNDMGGTTANILSGRNGSDSVEAGAAGGKLKGTPLSDQSAKDMNTKNINVPGGKAGKSGFTHKEPGHGAEKKGSSESPDNKQSLFRSRR